MIETPPTFAPTADTYNLIKPLLSEGFLQKIQNEYLYWSQLKYKAKAIMASGETLSPLK